MKKSLLSLCALLATALFFSSSSIANAALIRQDFVDPTVIPADMGNVVAGYKGKIDTARLDVTSGPDKGHYYDSTVGTLAPNTRLVFTFTVKSKTAIDTVNWLMKSTLDGVSFVSNQWTATSKPKVFTGTLIVENLTNAILDFTSTFLLDKNKIPDGFKVRTRYVSSAIPPVPLPAALPLFGLGLAGLAGYKRMRKNKNAA